MIGNDIVDIAYSNRTSDWRRPGYLQKLFTQDERLLIKNAICDDTMVWRLWSMKESAYKAEYRNSQKRVFNPAKYRCLVVDKSIGEVHFNDRVFSTQSTIDDNSIHSVALQVEGESSKLRSFLKDFQKQVSSAVLYQFLLEQVAGIQECDFTALTLRKTNAGVPEIFKGNQKLDVLCSISHHGQYGGVLIYC